MHNLLRWQPNFSLKQITACSFGYVSKTDSAFNTAFDVPLCVPNALKPINPIVSGGTAKCIS